MATTTYVWQGETEEARVLVVTNVQTKESVTIPKDAGYQRVVAGMAARNTSAAKDMKEFITAKVVADSSGDIARIKKWLAGGDGGIIAAMQAENDRLKAQLEALQKGKK